MAQDKVVSLYDWIFRKLRYYDVYATEATDALLATEFAEILAVDVSGKADKVAGATNNNFASLDADGNLKDSGRNASSFATSSHNHDVRYARLNASVEWDVTLGGGQTWTWVVDTQAPFVIDNTSGDILAVVTHLNADLLDGKHADEFANAVHTHSKYAQKAGTETITGPWTFSSNPPFALSGGAVDALVTGLNADKLDGNDATAFALVAHTHDDRYYTETEIDAMVALLLPIPITGAADGTILVYDGAGNVQTSPSLYSDLALASDIAGKMDTLPSGTPGNLVSIGVGGQPADSGSAAGDFAAASHTHDDRYYTETEMTNYATTISVYKGSTIESASYTIVGSNGSIGAGVTPAGTLALRIGGTTHYVIISATA